MCRNVWRIFLEQGEYEKAKQYSDGNQEHIDTIVIRQAEHYFKQGRLVYRYYMCRSF